jgi:hypothetical protein
MKYLTYIHAAYPPANISVGVWYPLNELQSRFTMDQIKMFFTPCNFAWEDLEPKVIKKRNAEETHNI